MSPEQLIAQTKTYVQETLEGAEAGHDWFHIERVYTNAMLLASEEAVDPTVTALGALLHDIADAKFYGGDETVGPTKARHFLESQGVDPAITDQVIYIIENISFKNSLEGPPPVLTPELKVVMDADRLDALGAIGIARAFHYGGYKNRKLFDPAIRPQKDLDKAAYKNSQAPTINHFYEKLLLLKDSMHTPSGKRLAAQRHEYMEGFLDQFYKEWGINP